MTTLFHCTLDGVSLSGLDESIVLLDIREDAPCMRTAALPLHTGGQHLLSQRRESITVQVRFAIHQQDPDLRQAVMQSIHTWAMKGGLLTISPRPGQQLQVACTALPALSFRDWPEDMTIAFTSTFSPWWEADSCITLSGTDAHTLVVPGTAGFADIEAIVCNTNASAVTGVTICCGDSRMTFEGLSIPSGSQLVLTHLQGVFLAALASGSALKYRTVQSSDDFLVPCGQTAEFSVTADLPLHTFFHVRGRYA